ncbi:MAG: NAD(P)H-dependent oxidoreductase [Pseudomonadota bacterium]
MTTSQTVLHIDASGRQQGSLSRKLSQQVVEKLIAANPHTQIVSRDLAASDLPFVDEAWIGANFTAHEDRTAEQQGVLALSDQLVEELRAADTVVIGMPVYNFGVPAATKAYIDQIARARVTFKYTDTGPVGLLTGKRAIVVMVSGGTSMGTALDFASGYMRHILGFVGITDVTFVDGTGTMIDADAAVSRANSAIENLAA